MFTADAASADSNAGPTHRLKRRVRLPARSPRFKIAAVGAAAIFIVNALIGSEILRRRGEAAATAAAQVERAAADMAGVVGDALRQTLRTSEELATLWRLRDDLDDRSLFDFAALIRLRAETDPLIADILALDPSGAPMMRSRESAGATGVGAAGAGTAGAGAAGAGATTTIAPGGAVFVPAAPATHRTAGATLPAIRRLENLHGEFDGTLATLIDLEHLGRRIRDALPGQGSFGAVLTGDRRPVVVVQPEERAGAAPPRPQDWADAATVAAAGRNAKIQRGGATYLAGFEKVAGFDFAVAVVRDAGRASAAWRREATAAGGVALALSGLIFLLTRRALSAQRTAETERSRLAGEARRAAGVLESMVDAVITIDGRGRILSFNPAAERLFQYAEDEIVGQSINVLTPQQHHQHHIDINPRATYGAGRSRILGADREILALRKDGGAFPITLAVSTLTGETNDAPPEKRIFVGVLRDVSAVKKHEAELLAAKTAAESASQAKSGFLADMSHELRTPLNAVIGFSEILTSEYYGALNEKQKACLKDINDSGGRLLEIVNAVLDMARLEAGGYEIREEILDVRESLTQCLQAARSRAFPRSVSIQTAFKDAPFLRADRRAFQDVVGNLLSNAVKFAPDGGKVVVESVVGPCGLEIRVSDDGDGVPDAFRPHMFLPFRHADDGAPRRHEGVGLGLAIAKRLMDLHGGDLRCDSRAGRGATFTAVFPAGRLTSAVGGSLNEFG